MQPSNEVEMLTALGFTEREARHLLFQRKLADDGAQVADGVGPRRVPRELAPRGQDYSGNPSSIRQVVDGSDEVEEMREP